MKSQYEFKRTNAENIHQINSRERFKKPEHQIKHRGKKLAEGSYRINSWITLLLVVLAFQAGRAKARQNGQGVVSNTNPDNNLTMLDACRFLNSTNSLQSSQLSSFLPNVDTLSDHNGLSTEKLYKDSQTSKKAKLTIKNTIYTNNQKYLLQQLTVKWSIANLKKLLESGFPVDAHFYLHPKGIELKYHLLHLAVQKNDLESINFLLNEAGAIPNLLSEGVHPLQIAYHYGSDEVAKILVEAGSSIVTLPPNEQLSLRGKLEYYKSIDANDEVNNRIEERFTYPLFIAVKYESKEAVDKLLKAGADLRLKNEKGYAAIHYAASDRSDLVETFLMNGADVNFTADNGDQPINTAMYRNNIESIKHLLKHNADPNHKNYAGFPPLIAALIHGHFETAQLLLDHKADIHVTETKHGKSAAHAVVRAPAGQEAKLISLLVKYSANLNKKDLSDKTAIDEAIEQKKVTVVEALLEEDVIVDIEKLKKFTLAAKESARLQHMEENLPKSNPIYETIDMFSGSHIKYYPFFNPEMTKQPDIKLLELAKKHIKQKEQEPHKSTIFYFMVTTFILTVIGILVGVFSTVNKIIAYREVKRLLSEKQIIKLNEITADILQHPWRQEGGCFINTLDTSLLIPSDLLFINIKNFLPLTQEFKLEQRANKIVVTWSARDENSLKSLLSRHANKKLKGVLALISPVMKRVSLRNFAADLKASMMMARDLQKQKLKLFEDNQRQVKEYQDFINTHRENTDNKVTKNLLTMQRRIELISDDYKKLSSLQPGRLEERLNTLESELTSAVITTEVSDVSFKSNIKTLARLEQDFAALEQEINKFKQDLNISLLPSLKTIEDAVIAIKLILTKQAADRLLEQPITSEEPAAEMIIAESEEDSEHDEDENEDQPQETPEEPKVVMCSSSSSAPKPKIADTRIGTRIITPARSQPKFNTIGSTSITVKKSKSSLMSHKPTNLHLKAAYQYCANLSSIIDEFLSSKTVTDLGGAICVHGMLYNIVRLINSFWTICKLDHSQANSLKKSIEAIRHLLVHGVSAHLAQNKHKDAILLAGLQLRDTFFDNLKHYESKKLTAVDCVAKLESQIAGAKLDKLDLITLVNEAPKLSQSNYIQMINDALGLFKNITKVFTCTRDLYGQVSRTSAAKMLIVRVGELLKRLNREYPESLDIPDDPLIQPWEIRQFEELRAILTECLKLRDIICHQTNEAKHNSCTDVDDYFLFKLIAKINNSSSLRLFPKYAQNSEQAVSVQQTKIKYNPYAPSFIPKAFAKGIAAAASSSNSASNSGSSFYNTATSTTVRADSATINTTATTSTDSRMINESSTTEQNHEISLNAKHL